MTAIPGAGLRPGRNGRIKLIDPLAQRGRTFLIVLTYVAAAIGVGVAVFATIAAGGLGGAGLSFLYALIPIPVLIGCYLWLDAYDPEPRRYLVAVFVWGAVGAVAIALAVQILADKLWDPSNATAATYIAPLSEEPAKGLILLFTFLRRRRVLDGIVNGFVYAGVAGLGFAFTENILYYTTAYVSATDVDMPGALGATGTFLARGVMTPFLHPLFSTWIGLGLVLAALSRRRVARIAYPLTGLAFGTLAHGGWNGAASSQAGAAIGLAFLVGLLLLAGLLTWALIARRNQGRVLWDALTDMANRRKWLHPDEVAYLARMGLRKRARTYAKRAAGQQSMNAVKAYQQLATRTAFLYDGVMRGRPKYDAVHRVDRMRADMAALRPHIVLPPPVRIVKRLPRHVSYGFAGYPPSRPPVPPPPGWQTASHAPALPQGPHGPVQPTAPPPPHDRSPYH